MTDNRSTPLAVGQSVVFNISGQVAHGRITALREPVDQDTGYGWTRRVRKPRIDIRLSHDAAGHPKGHISWVKNEKSVLVLTADVRAA